MTNEKLYRALPLHRRRKAWRSARRTLLNQEELCLMFDVAQEELAETLEARKLPYYRDAAGFIWASLPND